MAIDVKEVTFGAQLKCLLEEQEKLAAEGKELSPEKKAQLERLQSNFTRQSFGKIQEVQELPDLSEIQKESYRWLREKGLQEVFDEMEPISDYNNQLVLRFTGFEIDKTPKYSIEECKRRGATYSAPFHVKACLQYKDTGELKESNIYVGDFPLMTESGTFVVNGAERVIVSQIVRSPGAYFTSEKDHTGKDLFSAQVIPNRGAWLEYEMDSNDVIYARIDKNSKIPLTTFLRALGLSSNEDIFEKFTNDSRLEATISSQKDKTTSREQALIETYKKLRPGEPATADSGEQRLWELFFDPRRYDLCRFGRYKYNQKLGIANRLAGHPLSRPIPDPSTGETLYPSGITLNFDEAMQVQNAGVTEAFVTVEVKEYVETEDGEHVIQFINKEAKIIGNGMVDAACYLDPAILKAAEIDEKVAFSELKSILEETVSISDPIERAEAQVKLLRKRRTDYALNPEEEQKQDGLIPRHITKDDIFATVSYFLNLCDGVGSIDDIDHLGNRRIRSVGELMQNYFRIGYTRMERAIREKINSTDPSTLTLQTLVNTRPIAASLKEFFGSSPLSQFMDQNNPLAELTHKRRLSSLGPGGLSRDRAGFEVRDVHYTHYGRMCPIETPEGPNIGLISYLATYAKVNRYGFLEAPFRRVDPETHCVTDEVTYMSADISDNYVIAQADEPLSEDGHFLRSKVAARHGEQMLEIDPERIEYIDVSPKMFVSVATAMIPFLENDDANRALMGANMQRQAVPLLTTERSFVGTGIEYKAAVDSGVCILSEETGFVSYVDANKIDIIPEDGGKIHEYTLQKFQRSNQDTCINQRPIVRCGDHVIKGDVIADGPATSYGEISLGKNALVAFMTWEGYNFEDAVLINERLVREDVYTSVHIQEFEIECRETKLGPEEITRDIPNVGDSALKDLDENGIIRIGAEVHPGDILVGKVTPKGEASLTPDERLLRAIFGEKSREVRDNSLKLPHGVTGTVVSVDVFTRDNCDELSAGVNKLVRCYVAQKRKISVGDKMAGRHGNKGVVSRVLPEEDMPYLEDGTPIDIVLSPLGVPSRMNIGQVLEVHLGMAAKALGWHTMTPVFDGAHEKDIQECFEIANEANATAQKDKELLRVSGSDFQLNPMDKVINPKALTYAPDGKFTLYDGRTGKPFDNRITVGYMYYLKLHHLVDDKIHARSVGPYTLVTQQPLGGKAQFGGQRFGEMEVWALEAYGAAYTLQEILTVKSDDVVGRVNTYEAIVRGANVPLPGIPESFRVLVKEMQALGLEVSVLDDDGEEVDLHIDFDEEERVIPQPVSIDEEAEAEMTSLFTDHDLNAGFSMHDHDDAANDFVGVDDDEDNIVAALLSDLEDDIDDIDDLDDDDDLLLDDDDEAEEMPDKDNKAE